MERTLFAAGGATEAKQDEIKAAILKVQQPASLAVTGPVTGQTVVAGVPGQRIRLIRNAGHVDPQLSLEVFPLVTVRLGSVVVYRDKLEAGLPWSETVCFDSEPGDALTIDVDVAATLYLNMRYEVLA